jgi:hypothetical protein
LVLHNEIGCTIVRLNFFESLAMRYSLWGRGRLLGFTDLDLPHVQARVRLGFIEPTDDGLRLLPDATGVPTAAHALARASKDILDDGYAALTEYADFRSACDRREGLTLELRDEAGVAFDCEWSAIHDIQELASLNDSFDCSIYDEIDPEFEAAIEADSELIQELHRAIDDPGYDCGDDAWQPPDERWDSMRFYLMVYLRDTEPNGLPSPDP